MNLLPPILLSSFLLSSAASAALQPDAAALHHLQKVRLDVLANDPAGIDPATVEITTPPAFGTASVAPDGRILYTHTTGTPGTDSFTYRAAGPAGAGNAPVAVTLTFPASLRIAPASFNVPATPPATGGSPGNYPATLSATNLFADLTDLSPAPGVLPYAPNVAFWSDYAQKRRWFVIPDAAATMTWSRDGLWTYPDGMIWVKHFDMEMTRGNPATARRIETRLLVKNPAGVYGVSYRWNEAQTDAVLAPDDGADIPLNVVENGLSRVQNYRIPSRGECLSCHNDAAGHALSFNTRQLNRTENIQGFAGNQLTLLQNAGYFSSALDSPNLLPRHVRADETAFSVEARVRSYLDVNCANCHRDGGVATPNWDARAHLSLAQTHIINGPASNNGGDTANRLIVPGNTARSIILNRVAVTNGFTRMPPLGSNELDPSAIALLTKWITESLPTHQTYFEWRIARFESDDSAESEPTADADYDGADNYSEYLAGTDPRAGTSFLRTELSAPGTLTFTVPDNLPWQIETSTDLLNWSLLDVLGNNAVPRAAGPVSLTTGFDGPARAFRLRLLGN